MKRNIIIITLLVVAISAVLVLKKHQSVPGADAPPVSAHLPRLLELGSDQCVPCKMMAPILDELKETFAAQLRVDFIDVWKQEDIGRQYGLRVIPTQIFFDADGNELFRHEGFFAKEDILNKWSELGFDFSNR